MGQKPIKVFSFNLLTLRIATSNKRRLRGRCAGQMRADKEPSVWTTTKMGILADLAAPFVERMDPNIKGCAIEQNKKRRRRRKKEMLDIMNGHGHGCRCQRRRLRRNKITLSFIINYYTFM